MKLPLYAGADRASLASPALPDFTFAFQPIIDADERTIFSYEALVRGPANEPAGSVLAQVRPEITHLFDLHACSSAVELGARLGLSCRLNVNMHPRSVQGSDAPIRSLIQAAHSAQLPLDHLILEVTEGEMINDKANFADIVNRYRAMGLQVAIDDFGAGHSGLNLLADFQPDMLKLDMNLVRGIESKGPRQAIVRAILQACNDLGIDFLAEGVETVDEYHWFRDQGVRLFQGYLIARPAFEALAQVPFQDGPTAG